METSSKCFICKQPGPFFDADFNCYVCGEECRLKLNLLLITKIVAGLRECQKTIMQNHLKEIGTQDG